ncbi:unnamed protein product [Rhizoctonia solani]|uniref:Uncharacterized protein n=1 Tax=Rhizoctonia solani TaxID=456999 RepID=A0A8H3A4A3_9AGAM|nr:unnamed protein product [Rhizoctonia solani]
MTHTAPSHPTSPAYPSRLLDYRPSLSPVPIRFCVAPTPRMQAQVAELEAQRRKQLPTSDHVPHHTSHTSVPIVQSPRRIQTRPAENAAWSRPLSRFSTSLGYRGRAHDSPLAIAHEPWPEIAAGIDDLGSTYGESCLAGRSVPSTAASTTLVSRSQRIRYPPTLATDKLTIDKDLIKTYCGGFELIGLLAIFDPPRDNDKQTINDAIALGV